MITLLTDFGTSDYFVAAVKGVIQTLNPSAKIVDLTHDIPPQDISTAAFMLAACYRDFPKGTVHLVVVDPGVGSARRGILVEAGGQYFIGPDNGVFSLIYLREKDAKVFHLAKPEFFRQELSSTFHGRDVFAPVAGWLELGIVPDSMGVEIVDAVTLPLPNPQPTESGFVAEILHIDHFGNCITNLATNELRMDDVSSVTHFEIAEIQVHQIGTHYSQSGTGQAAMAYLGSAGYWELALWQDSLAAKLQVKRGAKVVLTK